jgi:tRNA-specific 2-thiouridylase
MRQTAAFCIGESAEQVKSRDLFNFCFMVEKVYMRKKQKIITCKTHNVSRGVPRVIVAMSGGVDSSVAAALMKKRGFEVEGVYMKLFDGENSAEESAGAVAEKLNIRLKIVDFRKEFKKAVIDSFLREFARARTPNPCVVCNQQIKFGLLFDRVLEMGGDYIATGHYARIEKKISNDKIQITNKIQNPKSKIHYRLLSAKDKTKDQLYFLYNLTQEKLRHVLFPLGGYKKAEVYQMAEKWELPYKKGESVDICFIAGGDHRDFLKKYLKMKPGKIVDVFGKVLGAHGGLSLHTIGQRADIGGPGPFYVVEMDSKKNVLIVTNNPRDPKLFRKILLAENVNWVSGIEPKLPLKCKARIRYGHAAVSATVLRNSTPLKELNSLRYKVIFKTPQRAITPGQSVVFYKRNEVLGGGVIGS